jgi:hypothetical protein
VKITKKFRDKIKLLLEKVVDKVIADEDRHWSDDWDKAEYRILKKVNETGRTSFTPQRRLNGEWQKLLNVPFALDTETDARHKILQDKEYYQDAWIRERAEKVEVIKVEI